MGNVFAVPVLSVLMVSCQESPAEYEPQSKKELRWTKGRERFDPLIPKSCFFLFVFFVRRGTKIISDTESNIILAQFAVQFVFL